MRHFYTLLILLGNLAASQKVSSSEIVGLPIPYPLVGVYNDGNYQIIMYKAGLDKEHQMITAIIARDLSTKETVWKRYAKFYSAPKLDMTGRGNGIVVGTSENYFNACPGCRDKLYFFRVRDGALVKADYVFDVHILSGALLTSPSTPPMSSADWQELTHNLVYEITDIATGKRKAGLNSLPDRAGCGVSTTISNAVNDSHVSGNQIFIDRQDKCGEFHIILDWTTFPATPMKIVTGKSGLGIDYSQP